MRLSRVPVCESCWSSLNTESRILCSRCGEDLRISSLPGSDTVNGAADGPVCDVCTKVPPPFRRAAAFGVYRSTLRSLIHSLKYDGMLPVADGLGARLAETILTLRIQEPEAFSGSMLVIPVPPHSSKRKFNHAELLAKAALRELHRRKSGTGTASDICGQMTLASDLLERKRATESQAGLTPHQRRVNVRGAFVVRHPDRLRGAQVLLIDDIYTTGATARACSKALLKVGAASVWVVTVARAQFEHITRPQMERLESAVMPQPEADLPMHADVAFWDSALKDEAKPLVH